LNKEKCKSCGAEIVWAKTQEGKTMPLNARRVRAYRLKELETGEPVAEPSDEPVYISHFLTCPQASQWSKGKD
jgi:hypothetical protein